LARAIRLRAETNESKLIVAHHRGGESQLNPPSYGLPCDFQ
jgi:hypothetical protein